MPVTYKLIATTTVSTATAASMEFTSIPATFDDLVVKFSARMSNAANVVDDVIISFNGSTSNFAQRRLFGDGSAANSGSNDGSTRYVAQAPNASATASTFGNAEVYISNYAGSANKSVSADAVSENNATASYQFFSAVLWSNSAAITSVTLNGLNSNFVQHSTATLYGIKKS